MYSYSFKLTLKKELGMFEKSTFISDIKDSCTNYNQFVFGMNIKKVKNVKINKTSVNVTLNLINKISDNDFDDAVKNVIKLMKKKGYSLKKENNKKTLSNKSNTKKKQIQIPKKLKKKLKKKIFLE